MGVTTIPISVIVLIDKFLVRVTDHKDLGVVFDDVLKFHSHVFTIVSKANRTLGMIKKCFTASTLLVLYKNL